MATVEAGRRICPECGYEFEIGELGREVLPGDWTAGRGLGRSSVRLLVRSVLCLPIWTGILFVVLALAAWLSSGRTWFVVLVAYLSALIVVLISSAAIGRVQAKGMDEEAGMVSVLVAALITGFTWAVIAAGALVVCLCLPSAGRGVWPVAAISGGMALIFIIKTHFFD